MVLTCQWPLPQLQRLLVGSGHGIQCYACNVKAGIIAIAEQVSYGMACLTCRVVSVNSALLRPARVQVAALC
jgi:hypothetical protein